MEWNACTLEPNSVVRWMECHPGTGSYIQAFGGIAALVLSIVGMVLLWRTLYFTRKATEAAQQAVLAHKTEIQPFIKVDAATVLLSKNNWLEETYPLVTIEASNTGSTPAKEFRWGVRTLYAYPGADPVIQQVPLPAPEAGIAVAAGEKVTQREWCWNSSFNIQDIAAAQAADFSCFIEITIVYRNAFNDEFRDASLFRAFIASAWPLDPVILRRYPGTIEEAAASIRPQGLFQS